MTLPQVSVCYLLRERGGRTEVLLGRKLRGFGEGYVVGPGGKLEPGESTAEAAARELLEETGFRVETSALEYRGRVTYLFPHRDAWSLESNVFVSRRFGGEQVASDELALEWFDVDEVPFAEMWDDARRWLPGVLAGGRASGTFVYGRDLATVVEAPTPVA
ncbi:8-oxo-dGTP diphosphatase [Agromyces protaetiae]|nr:8-oxo-dGTP diphosphatase [Agromyces protaetiae]